MALVAEIPVELKSDQNGIERILYKLEIPVFHLSWNQTKMGLKESSITSIKQILCTFMLKSDQNGIER